VSIVAGVDIGNATTEIVVLDGRRLLGADRLPTRGRKGSADSLVGAAALVRRAERRLGARITEVAIAPLRAAGTATITVPAQPPRTGRLRVLTAGAATPGGTGWCVGAPFWLDRGRPAGYPGEVAGDGAAWIALVPAALGYQAAAGRLRDLRAAGVPVGAVLAAGDEGVLIANRLGVPLPVLDQADVVTAAGCAWLAIEVRPPGQPLVRLTDPVALAAALGLGGAEAGDAATLARSLLDYSNAVIGVAGGGPAPTAAPGPGDGAEAWVLAGGRPVPLRAACARMASWPVGHITGLRAGADRLDLDDLFAVDLAAVADSATARRGSTSRALLVASLSRLSPGTGHAATLAAQLDRPVHCPASEPSAARLGAATTPGAAGDAVVVDIGAGTIDVIAPDGEVVAAGAGDLLTAAVAQTLGLPRAAADWVKRGPSVRVEDGQRFVAEDGSRGFLDQPASPAAAGQLAAAGPAGLLPFDRQHSPAEWRALRLRLKEAVLAANLRRAVTTLGQEPRQVIIVGGPAGDDELIGVLLRALPAGVAAGRGNVGGTLDGTPAGHRHAAALGLALALAR
jgi:Diol dehydratase reactivase ATPase-like domain/DD-reactivating factor swiveling domain